MKNESYKVFALKKGKVLFQEFADGGSIVSIDAKEVKSRQDFYYFNDRKKAEFMLAEYEDRLKGFKVCELECTETFSFKEV